MSNITATIVGDSISPTKHRISSVEVVMPRYILAELNTHRVFSRNSASSRAIPAITMIEQVKNNPFIPVAFQKEHKGMQGYEYYTEEEVELKNLRRAWLASKNIAVDMAMFYVSNKVTKQLSNRLLEPFMWHKVLITATEWENFFQLRSPQYRFKTTKGQTLYFRSKKDWIAHASQYKGAVESHLDRVERNPNTWWEINESTAEIHIQLVAEAIWDALNESTPKELKAGEWHIPYQDKMDESKIEMLDSYKITDKDRKIFGDDIEDTWIDILVKISTGMCARTSYTTVGNEKEINYQTFINIHNKMLKEVPFHASPFEHCAKTMSDNEYDCYSVDVPRYPDNPNYLVNRSNGWSRNFRGFIQYREIIENDRHNEKAN